MFTVLFLAITILFTSSFNFCPGYISSSRSMTGPPANSLDFLKDPVYANEDIQDAFPYSSLGAFDILSQGVF